MPCKFPASHHAIVGQPWHCPQAYSCGAHRDIDVILVMPRGSIGTVRRWLTHYPAYPDCLWWIHIPVGAKGSFYA